MSTKKPGAWPDSNQVSYTGGKAPGMRAILAASQGALHVGRRLTLGQTSTHTQVL